jgi:hypothetical protein
MSFSYSPSIVQSGLVLYLDAANTKSYPTTGTAWNDLSRSGNNGTLINGPIFNSGNGGNIQFDGVDDYVNLGTFQAFTNNFTVSVWCRLNTTGFNILGFYNTSSPFNGWGLGYNQSPRDGGFLNFWDGGSWKNPNIIVNDGQWRQITVAINSTFLLSFYINGVFSASVQGANIASFTGNKAIGARNDSLGPMSGNISQVKIYNRALSAQEILQNYNATKSRYGLT